MEDMGGRGREQKGNEQYNFDPSERIRPSACGMRLEGRGDAPRGLEGLGWECEAWGDSLTSRSPMQLVPAGPV